MGQSCPHDRRGRALGLRRPGRVGGAVPDRLRHGRGHRPAGAADPGGAGAGPPGAVRRGTCRPRRPGVDDPEVATRVSLERGRLLRSAGEPDEARPHFEAAAVTAREAGLEALHVDALHMVALVAPAEDRQRLNEEALAVARASSDPEARRLGRSPAQQPRHGARRRRRLAGRAGARSRRRWPPASGSAKPAAPGSLAGWSAGRCATSAAPTRRSPCRPRSRPSSTPPARRTRTSTRSWRCLQG